MNIAIIQAISKKSLKVERKTFEHIDEGTIFLESYEKILALRTRYIEIFRI